MRALTQLKIAGTRSFRLSASQLFEYGLNAQNSDKETIDIFEAPRGWRIVQVDQAGAEALIVAYLTRPGKYRGLFTAGVKPHTYLALHLFLDKFRGEHPPTRYWLQPPEVLKALPEWPTLSATINASKFEYDIGKRTGHSGNYEVGPQTFRQAALKDSEGQLNLTHEQATFFLDTYKQVYPEIVEWQAETKDTVRSQRLLRNLFGYPRRFERIVTDSYLREAISWVPQSTVGCITHVAYRIVTDYIRAEGLSWRLFNNKHDSYAALVPAEQAERAAHYMSGAINQKLVGRDGVEFFMKSEVQVGGNMKKAGKDNPDGLVNFKLN
jgi:hypothetical protein